MSSKADKADKMSSSKMLKKAQSFRDDLRNRIKRRPSTGVQQMIPDGSSKNSNRKSNRLDATDGQFGSTDDLDELRQAMDEVNKTLIFIKAVVSKGKTEVLPGTASVILETVMKIFTLLRYPLLAQESNSLTSSQSRVCQMLAKFIAWTDCSLVGDDSKDTNADTCGKEEAEAIIDPLLEGIQEMTKLGMEKMSQKVASNANRLQAPIVSQPLPSPPGENADIPLTPREQEILAQTSSYSGQPGKSSSMFSFEPNTEDDDAFGADLPSDQPPLKPPLPTGVIINKIPSSLDCVDGCKAGELVPPPLPQKTRQPSTSLDFLGGSASSTDVPKNIAEPNILLPGQKSTLLASAALDRQLGLASKIPEAPADLLQSGRTFSQGSLSSLQSARSSTSMRSSSSSVVSRSSVTTSSFSQVVRDGDVNAGSLGPARGKLLGSGAGGGGKTFEEINELTSQIKELTHCIEEIPPPLPAKKGTLLRLNSQYDNVPELMKDGRTQAAVTTHVQQQQQQQQTFLQKMENRTSSSSLTSTHLNHHSQSSQQLFHSVWASEGEHAASSHETFSSSETFSSTSHSSTESLPKPPPLPPKKKHVQAYMQTFGALTQPVDIALDESISRHSITFYEAQWHQHQKELFYPRSNTISVFSDISSGSSVSDVSADLLGAGPQLPIKMKRMSDISQGSLVSTTSSTQSDVTASTPDVSTLGSSKPTDSVAPSQIMIEPAPAPKLPVTPLPDKEVAPLAVPEIQKDSDSDFSELNPLDDVDITDQLIFKQEGEDGPEIRGGAVDALVVYATQAGKLDSDDDLAEQSEFMFQEAFLTTYRMFISPKELMEKLLYRFNKFQHTTDNKKKLAHNAFSLLIRVVDELGCNEIDSSVVKRLMSLVNDLICEGSINLARILRLKLLEKCEQKQVYLAEILANASSTGPVQAVELTSSGSDLLNFKAHDIAEQMTLLDAQLFQKIVIPEVLMWAREQSEELSPHLTTFTEHFNKMSYWCRTRILTQDDPRDRERYLIKFIKIMRHLRKLHNFNSYLAILSALDSAPVRRLEWQKQNIEALQEFCQLIDSSSSFRAYRQALAETEPPCIPYLGLILQDLTFINIGNQDKLPDGSINFAKHWQQFNILDSMRRFRTSTYQIKRNDKIMNMLNNFENFLSEDRLWSISQKIKPRTAGHKKQNSIS